MPNEDPAPTPTPALAVVETTDVTYETPTYDTSDTSASLTQAALEVLAVMPSLL